MTKRAADSIALQPLSEDPEYSVHAAMLARVSGALAAGREEIEQIELSLYLETLPAKERQAYAGSVRAPKEQAPHGALPPDLAAADFPEAVMRAWPLLLGRAADYQDPRRRLEELRRIDPILREARAAQAEKVDEIRGRKSAQACASQRPRHAAILIRLYRGAQQVAAAAAEERALFALLRDHGYEIATHKLARGWLPALLAVGDEGRYNSQISHLRRELEAQGLI